MVSPEHTIGKSSPSLQFLRGQAERMVVNFWEDKKAVRMGGYLSKLFAESLQASLKEEFPSIKIWIEESTNVSGIPTFVIIGTLHD